MYAQILSEPECSSQLDLDLECNKFADFCFRDNLDAYQETLCPVICTDSLDRCILFKFTFLYLLYILSPILALFTQTLHEFFLYA